MVPLSKYMKSVFHTRVSVGMRFRMLFETEECSVRRYVTTDGLLSGIHCVWPYVDDVYEPGIWEL